MGFKEAAIICELAWCQVLQVLVYPRFRKLLNPADLIAYTPFIRQNARCARCKVSNTTCQLTNYGSFFEAH